MRMFGRLTAVFLLCALLGSCATMMAYEQERQKKRSKPAVAATTGQEAVGSLFQPNLPKPKVDTQGLAASQSVANAEKQLAETDPTKTAGVAPGPSIPMLKTLLLTREDLDAVSKSYAAYSQAVTNVRVSLEAYGLKSNLTGLRRVREAGEYWGLYMPRMRIRPTEPGIKAEDIQAFYGVVTEKGKQVMADTGQINRYIDSQRTKAWTVSNRSR